MNLCPLEISFIVSVYNDEDYLSECIESILSQDDICFEIIIINDGSTDRSLEIASSFSYANDNVRVFSFENSGLSISRNRGIEKANGKYIQFVDSDDMLPEKSISRIIQRMESDKLDLFCGSASVIDASGAFLSNIRKYARNSSAIMTGRELFNATVDKQYIASSCLIVCKRKILDRIRFFPNIYHEDNLFTAQVHLSSAVKRAAHSSDILYIRRIRPGSITQVKVTTKHALGYCRVASELRKELLSGNYDEVTYDSLIYLHKKMLVNVIYHFNYFSFKEGLVIFINVFKSMPLNSLYCRLHLKNIYYFIFRNSIFKRLQLVFKEKYLT